MAANSSFTLNGALSGSLPINQYSTSNMATPGGNPVSRALNLAAAPVISPSTPLKSTTINNADGSSTTHTFHAPADFSKAGRIDSAGNFEVPSKIPGIGFAPASPTSSGALSSNQIAVLTGQAPASSLTSSTPTSQKTAQSQASTPTPSQSPTPTQVSAQAPAYTPPTADAASPQSTYAGLLKQAIDAQNRAANYRADLTRNVENTARQGAPVGDVARGLAGQESIQGTAEEQRLADLASNATALANAYRPYQQGYVLIDPTTGKPVGGGTAGSAAFQGGQIEAQGAQGAQVEGYKSALQQGQNLQSQLGDLITSFGLNPADVNAVNSGIQAIARNTSDPRYQILNNYINDIANTYAQILTPPGGSATDTTRGIAASMLDATAKGTSILDVMKSLDAAANAKIAGTPTYQGSQSAQNTGSFSEGQTASSGGYDFVYRNGKWVPK